jgi:AcrR family transcriptional regulator
MYPTDTLCIDGVKKVVSACERCDGCWMSKADESVRPYHHGSIEDAALQIALRRLREGDASIPSLRGLAAAVGVTHRALYRYFPDRNALSAAVAGEGFRMLGEAMTASDDAASSHSVMRAYLGFAFAETSLYTLMFSIGERAFMREPAPGPQVRQVIAIATKAFDNGGDRATTRDRVIAAWGMAHGLFELSRAGALRAANPDRAVDFIMSRLETSRLV